MLVFWKEKLVLLAVPKTGTTALDAALAEQASIRVSHPPELKHAPVYRYNRFFRPMWEKACKAELETFALMREPISWLRSWYLYRQRPLLDGHPNSTASMSFDEFVDAYLKGKKPPFANVGSQYTFLESRPNGCAVDHLFQYEQPQIWQNFLEKRLGRTIALDKINVSPSSDVELSTKMQSKCQRKLAHEFELWRSLEQPVGRDGAEQF